MNYKRSITIQLLLLPLVALAIETPVPERFLAPRDFNPHPITDVRRPQAKYKRLNIPGPADVYAQYLQNREPAYKGQEYLQYASQEQQQQTQARYEEQQEEHHNEYARADQYHQNVFGTTGHDHSSPDFDALAINEAYANNQYASNRVQHHHEYDTSYTHQYVTAAPPVQYVTVGPTPTHQYIAVTPQVHHHVPIATHQFVTPTSQFVTPTPQPHVQHFATPTPHHVQQQHYPPETFVTDVNKHQHQEHHADSYDERIPKQYAFSYAVLDHHSGDDFSHAQKHDGHSTEGQYRVKLPDGRTQIVKYTADNLGYRAKVSYEPSSGLEASSAHVKRTIVNPTQTSYYKQQEPTLYAAAATADNQYVTSTYPSVDKHRYKNHYTKAQQQQFRSTTYPSVPNKPHARTFYKHHDLTVATTYPTVPSGHHYNNNNEPNVHVEYNGAKIEQSQQVYEQHHIYKRDNKMNA